MQAILSHSLPKGLWSLTWIISFVYLWTGQCKVTGRREDNPGAETLSVFQVSSFGQKLTFSFWFKRSLFTFSLFSFAFYFVPFEYFHFLFTFVEKLFLSSKVFYSFMTAAEVEGNHNVEVEVFSASLNIFSPFFHYKSHKHSFRNSEKYFTSHFLSQINIFIFHAKYYFEAIFAVLPITAIWRSLSRRLQCVTPWHTFHVKVNLTRERKGENKKKEIIFRSLSRHSSLPSASHSLWCYSIFSTQRFSVTFLFPPPIKPVGLIHLLMAAKML